ncbi:MAG: isoprenylcysteine carboxylmethyltransferase family protein [Nitrospinae bacterium]|nr:isoprenylcysteine carboxylmethyltransferase family protein [Nitrospinota bacterium]
MKVTPPLIKACIIFPMNVMGVIPAILIWCSQEGRVFEKYPPSFDLFRSFPGGLLVGAGASLCWVSVSLFTEFGGGGTPAPYDPPKKFVVRGVYTRVRNPMMIGVIIVLLGEAMLSGSLPVFIWALIFIQACLVLIPFWEEPDLERRFGEAYLEYKRKVPRWIPNLKSSSEEN